MHKIAFVCGGSSGIGKSVVTKFLSEEYLVFTTSRRKPDIESENLVYLPSDFNDNESILKVCKSVEESSGGGLDAVVNCVGDIYAESRIQDLEIESVIKTFQINLFSSIWLGKYLFQSVAARKGCFVFLSSVAKDKVYPQLSDYCAAKSALSNFVKSLALELSEFNARAVALSPAVVNTPLFEKSRYTVEEAAAWHKLSRVGTPEEIAELIYFLVGKQAGWITGTDYLIDGGLLL